MQIRLRTNLGLSLASEDRLRADHRVWFAKLRDPPSIFLGAVFRVENDGGGQGVGYAFVLYKRNEPVLEVGSVSAKFSVLTIPPDDFTPVLWARFVPLVFEIR